MSTPVAYLRKSRVTLASPGEMSHEAQLTAVKELAVRHGDPEPLILSDWSRSGRKGAKGRPGYAELLRMIESGEASAVYSYSLSRLSRSVRDFASLVEVAQAHDVPVRLARDTMNLGTASGRLNVNVLASVAAFEAEIAQERAQDTITARRVRGDHVGSAPYGYILSGGQLKLDPDRPIEPVIEAYRATHGYAATARLLNERNMPAPRGKKWSAPAVRRVVNRTLPETRSVDGKPGRRVRQDFILSRLLVCPCGGVMTGRRESRTTKYGTFGPYISYVCFRGRYQADHQRPYMVAETLLLPWIKAAVIAEMARLRLPDAVEVEVDDTREDVLEAKRDRYVELFATSGIDRATFDAKVLPLDEELARLRLTMAASRITEVPAIEWDSDDPADVGRVLRAMWERIELDASLRPLRAVPWSARLRAD